MKSITRFISLFSFFLLLLSSLQASHYKGAEVTYESLGGCNYRIIVTEYFDCSGIVVTPSQPTGGIEFYDSFAVQYTGTALNAWALVSDSEVINLTAAAAPGGTNCNGGSALGVRKFVFQRDYDLCGISAPIKISLDACCRGGAVSNLAGSGMQTYQYSTDIMNATVSNTSPTWLDPSFTILPNGFNHHQVSMAAYDAEGDSLAYLLDTIYTAPWQPINFNPGYSFTQPFSLPVNLIVDSSTGSLNITGTPALGEYALGLKVNEYRNGTLLSTSRRDFTIIISGGLNSNAYQYNPYIAWNSLPAPTNGSFLDSVTVSTSVGASLVIPIAADNNGLSSTMINLTWSQNLPGAQLFEMPSNTPVDTIVSLSPQAELRWTPTAPGRYAFNVKLRNDSQPVWSMSDVSYVITVAGTPPPPCTMTVDIGPDSAEICDGDFAQLNSLVQGGSAPYAYAWSTGENTPNILVGSQGTYYLQVMDANNCDAWDTIFVDVFEFAVDIGADTTYICDGDSVLLISNVTQGPGSGAYMSTWSTGETTPNIWATTQGVYSVQVLYPPNGCVATDTAVILDSPYCVWPGDADNDLIANNLDLLAIGLTYGDTGAVRAGASLTWEAQLGSAWTTSLPSGLNAVFTDTDGNGIVNDDDTLAINLNYGQTHLKGNTAMAGAGDPLLYLTTANDSVGAGETVNIAINLGVDSLTADSIYGLAFTVQYNNSVVDSFSAHVSYNGWLGTYGTDLLGIQKDFYNDGEVEVALVRNDQQIVSGFGMIANLSIVMIDDIAGKTAVSEILNLDLIDVRVIGLDGEEIPVNTDGTQVVVTAGGANSIEDELAKQIRIYPQPAQDQLIVALDEPQNWHATLYTLSGQRLVSVSSLRGTQESIDLSPYANGLYNLRVRTDQGIISKKVMITR